MSNPARALSALDAIDPSSPREIWTRAGMAAKAAGLSLGQFTTWSSGGTNFAGPKDCESAWRSFKPGPVGEATLYHIAFDAGWKDPGSDARVGQPTRHSPVTARRVFRPAAPDVGTLWEQLEAAPVDHGYIATKHGNADGLRAVPSQDPLVIAGHRVAGWLAVPVRSLAGNLRTLQFIPPPGAGKKLNLPGASFGDGLFVVGERAQPERIFIVEGIGQAWACHRATLAPAVVCFGAGRISVVASSVRDKYPDARLTIVPDRGKETQAAAVAAAVNAEWVALPVEKPENYDANDYMQEFGTAALSDVLEAPHSPPTRYRLLAGEDLAALQAMKWHIKGILPAEGLAAVYGPSGSGKSFLVLDALQCLASGKPWFGHRVKPCPVVYCALEGEGGISSRVKAYRERYGETATNIRYLLQPFSLLAAGDVQDLARAIKAVGASGGVVVLDTLNRSAPGADENDSRSMGQIIASAKELQTLVGGLVLLVHHTGKDANKGLRGHSSLHAALDAAIEIRRDGDGREWIVAKSKDGEDGVAHRFTLDVVSLGKDDDGEPITSCVVQPMSERPDYIRRALPPKSVNQRIVWDALGELFREAGDTRPENVPESLPDGRPCIRLEDAIEKIRSRLPCDPKRQTERTQDAIRRLVTGGWLHFAEGFLWCQ